jgi:X-Pro dipeptidyl-peptidase (S15 family)
MIHGTYDEYWQSRNIPKDLRDITHPVLIVASWFDAQDFRGPFRMYRSIEEKNPACNEEPGQRHAPGGSRAHPSFVTVRVISGGRHKGLSIIPLRTSSTPTRIRRSTGSYVSHHR